MDVKRAQSIQEQAEKMTAELANTKDPSAWAEEAMAALRWVEARVAELQRGENIVNAEYARLHAIYHGPNAEGVHAKTDDVSEGKRQRSGFCIVTGVETVAASKLALMFWSLPAVPAAVIAAAFSWATSEVATSIAGTIIRRNAERQGPVMKTRAHRLLIVLGVPWLIALVGAVCTLRSGGGKLVDMLFAVFTTLLTFLSPCLAGTCRAAAPLFLWSYHLNNQAQAIRSAMAAVEILRSVAGENNADGQGNLAGVPPSSGPAPVPTVTMEAAPQLTSGEAPANAVGEMPAGLTPRLRTISGIIVLALLLWPMAVRMGRAQDQRTDSMFATSSSRPALPVGTGRVNLKGLLDNSSSPDGSRVMVRFSELLNTVERDPREVAIEIATFGSDGWSENVIAGGRLPALSGGPCSREPSERARLSKRSWADYTASCAAEAAEGERAARASRAQQLENLRDAVRRLKPEPRSACTAVWDAIRGAEYAGTGQIVVILSDFGETCRKTVPKAPAEPPHNRVFAVPVMPSPGQWPHNGVQTRSESEFFEGVRSLLEKNFPELTVLEPFRISEVLR